MFDCFDGTLLAYFKQSTGITKEEPLPPTRSVHEVIEDIWANRDRDYNIACLVKRLQRIDKSMSADARTAFAAWIPNGDVAGYARSLKRSLQVDFVQAMGLLRTAEFQDLLVNYPRAQRTFIKAYEQTDTVSSTVVLRDIAFGE